MSKKKFIIDVDKAIEVYNTKNPDNKIDRYKLAEKLGLTYQTMTNYKGGRVPQIIGKLKEILEITDVDFEDLVKQKKSNI